MTKEFFRRRLPASRAFIPDIGRFHFDRSRHRAERRIADTWRRRFVRPCAEGRQPRSGARRGDRHRRSFGLGQVDIADGAGRPGKGRFGYGPNRRRAAQRQKRGPDCFVSWPKHWHCVPVLPSHSQHDGARKCRGAAGAGRPCRSVFGGGARTGGGRPERPRHPLSRRTVGRRTAARRDRPGAGAVAAHSHRRRADRQSRPGDGAAGRRPAVCQGGRARHDAGAGHP